MKERENKKEKKFYGCREGEMKRIKRRKMAKREECRQWKGKIFKKEERKEKEKKKRKVH